MNNKNPKTHKKAIKIEHSRILYKKEYQTQKDIKDEDREKIKRDGLIKKLI